MRIYTYAILKLLIMSYLLRLMFPVTIIIRLLRRRASYARPLPHCHPTSALLKQLLSFRQLLASTTPPQFVHFPPQIMIRLPPIILPVRQCFVHSMLPLLHQHRRRRHHHHLRRAGFARPLFELVNNTPDSSART